MRAAGRPGRGERAKVAARVRDLVAGDDPAARTQPLRRATEPAPSWLPGADFELHVPRHDVAPERTWRHRLRWDPGRKGATALGVAVVAVVAATGWWLAASRPHEVPISSSPGQSPVSASSAVSTPASVSVSSSSTGPSSGTGAATPASGRVTSLVVDVAGKVRHPGIYSLAAGSRVDDALRAAGGAQRGVSTVSLNLAAPLHDGQQIVVGVAGASAVPDDGGAGTGSGAGSGGGGGTGTTGAPAVVDLNTATLEQLETLPGVGPVLGQHILDWRSAHGQFASVDQLREVSGIGDVRFAQLRPLVAT